MSPLLPPVGAAVKLQPLRESGDLDLGNNRVAFRRTPSNVERKSGLTFYMRRHTQYNRCTLDAQRCNDIYIMCRVA